MMDPIEVFRTGKHPGSDHLYTAADLDTMVSLYNPAAHEAPVVIGHPTGNAPAFGWVKSLCRKGSVLFAELGDLAPEFVDAWKAGRYKKRSISHYPDLSLRHVGFLGAMPPVVKGLADAQFSEQPGTTIEFMESDEAYSFRNVGRLFGQVRDFLIEKFGLESADKILPKWDVDNLASTQATEPAMAFAEKPANQNQGASVNLEQALAKIAQLEADLTAEKSNATSFSEKATAIATELSTLKAEVATGKKAARTKEFSELCDKLISEGRLAPVNKPMTIVSLELAAEAGETRNFAEGEKKPLDMIKETLTASPVVLEFSEVATRNRASSGGGDLDANELAAKARVFQDSEKAAGRSVSFSECVAHVKDAK
jgi:hypothetical protein